MKRFIVVLTAFIVFFFTSCDDRSLGLPITHTVKYEITGTAAKVDITMRNSGENTEQYSDISIPWETIFDVTIDADDYYFAYYSAQNQGSAGSVTVKIFDDRDLFKIATSSGAYVIARASGGIEY
jgi:hypothetical protein